MSNEARNQVLRIENDTDWNIEDDYTEVVKANIPKDSHVFLDNFEHNARKQILRLIKISDPSALISSLGWFKQELAESKSEINDQEVFDASVQFLESHALDFTVKNADDLSASFKNKKDISVHWADLWKGYQKKQSEAIMLELSSKMIKWNTKSCGK